MDFLSGDLTLRPTGPVANIKFFLILFLITPMFDWSDEVMTSIM